MPTHSCARFTVKHGKRGLPAQELCSLLTSVSSLAQEGSVDARQGFLAQ